MHTVFFEYEGKTYFFGSVRGKTTGFTSDVNQARSELDFLNSQLDAPLPGSAATRASFVQAMVHREIDIANDGTMKSRNFFPESLIVEFRTDSPSNGRSHFRVFLLKSQRIYTNEANLEHAVRTARGLHELAALDPSKWPEMAEEAGLID